MKIDIQKPVDNALKLLKEQQRYIIVSRFELNGKKKQSLQEIADGFQLTRERVRQIQVSAIERLRKDDCVALLSKTIKLLEETLEECGSVATEERICNVCNLANKKERGYARLLLEIGDSFNKQKISKEMNSFWYTSENKKNEAERIISSLNKEIFRNVDVIYKYKDVVNLINKVSSKNIKNNKEYVSLLDISLFLKRNKEGEWGHYKNPQISLKGISGYISLVLSNAGEPLHFEEISRRISELKGKKCYLGSCHNELVRSNKFFLVGRGLYVMNGMGYESGTISEVLIKIIKENGSITQEKAVEIVKKKKIVKEKSIRQNLLNKKYFTKNKEGKYILVV